MPGGSANAHVHKTSFRKSLPGKESSRKRRIHTHWIMVSFGTASRYTWKITGPAYTITDDQDGPTNDKKAVSPVTREQTKQDASCALARVFRVRPRHVKKILFAFGTRPEAIKLAPLILQMREQSGDFSVRVCVTGQHRELLDQMLVLFGIKPDHDLNLMRPGQSLAGLTGAILERLPDLIKEEKPDLVLVQGDTTTAFVAGLSAYYAQVPVGHVEAGLRTGNMLSPFPEEANRRLLGVLADIHFAPTERARANLISENVLPQRIHVTGNTGIDALFHVLDRLDKDRELERGISGQFPFLDPRRRLILVTGHRRENFGEGIDRICEALKSIAEKDQGVEIVWPIHLNPNVRESARRALGAGRPENGRIRLIEPVDYVPFVYLMKHAHFIITDSGGIQEEAPALGKPVLVMRDVTERPEGVWAKTVKLVGTGRGKIFQEIKELLENPVSYQAMAQARNPYGDGQAAQRIVEIIEQVLNYPV